MPMKACSRCSKSWPLENFSKKKQGKMGHSAHCKECQKLYWDKYYSGANRKRHIARTTTSNKARRARLREVLREMKSTTCSDCEQVYPYYVMQFDHLPGQKKEGNLSALLANGLSLERLKEEAKKCQVVCSNCHAERTFQRTGFNSLRVHTLR